MSEVPGRTSPAATNRIELSRDEWVAEVTGAIVSAGLRWVVFAATVEQGSPMCYAEVTHSDQKETCRISLARDRFSTLDLRREEILRQVLQGRRTR